MGNSRLNLAVSAVVLAAAGSGCSQGTVSIGDQQPATQAKTGLAAFAANWDGYIEAYNFTDGSDRVRITVNNDATGTARFGNEELWPAATDPNTKYPPNFPQYLTIFPPTPLPPAVWDGYNYNLKGLRVEAERIRGSSWSQDIFGGWCALQTPNPTVSGQTYPYSCAPTCGYIAIGSPQQPGGPSDTCYTFDPCPTADPTDWQSANAPFPCERLTLCGLQCVCDATSCALTNLSGTDDVTLDAALDDTQQTMTGTLALQQDQGQVNYTVVLKRQ